MEFLVYKRPLFIITASLILTACSEEKEFINSSESVDMRFNESKEWNNNHSYSEIFVASDDYNILAMADCHVGGTTNLDKFFKKAANENPVAVVMDGDLTGGLSDDYNLFEKHIPSNDSI